MHVMGSGSTICGTEYTNLRSSIGIEVNTMLLENGSVIIIKKIQ